MNDEPPLESYDQLVGMADETWMEQPYREPLDVGGDDP